MPRLPRNALPAQGVFHVTARGVAGLPAFIGDVDRLDFQSLLASIGHEFSWSVHAHCLMTTHYHVVVETPLGQLSDGMKQLNGRYAKRFNRRHGRRGHLFESRFSAWVVRDEEHLRATCEYVLANPVKAGLCDRLGDWPWASAAALGGVTARPGR